jgi:UPF0716 family protein affecting phage T7 exclusion
VFVTDALCFLLLVPPLRRRLFGRMVVGMRGAGVYGGFGGGFQSGPGDTRPSGGNTLEGRYRRDDD